MYIHYVLVEGRCVGFAGFRITVRLWLLSSLHRLHDRHVCSLSCENNLKKLFPHKTRFYRTVHAADSAIRAIRATRSGHNPYRHSHIPQSGGTCVLAAAAKHVLMLSCYLNSLPRNVIALKLFSSTLLRFYRYMGTFGTRNLHPRISISPLPPQAPIGVVWPTHAITDCSPTRFL